MRRVLVTGAGGFVGRHAMPALCGTLGPNDQVAAIGRNISNFAAEPDGRVTYRTLDLLDEAALSGFVKAFRPTEVLHLAALSSVQQSIVIPEETWRVNVVGLLNLAKALKQGAPGAILFFVSSGEVYGRAFLAGCPADEETAPQPVSSYARTKLAGEQMLLDILGPADVKPIILRPFNHVGPGQEEWFVVAAFAGQIARIEAGLSPPELLVGNLEAQRDFLAVADVVDAYLGVMAKADTIAAGTVFNVASGQPRRIGDILETLRGLGRRPFAVVPAPDRMRASEIPVTVGDARRLTAATGWTPTADWTRTLSDILDHARRLGEVVRVAPTS